MTFVMPENLALLTFFANNMTYFGYSCVYINITTIQIQNTMKRIMSFIPLVSIYHHWEPNEPIPIDPRAEGDHDPYYTYTDTTPEITSIKNNWGWWTQWQGDYSVNDGWYSLTANWTVTAHGDTYSYNYILGTIYDIAAIPNN